MRFIFLALFLFGSLVNAQSYVYVTDKVDIPMRSTNKIQSNPSNLIKMVSSGTKLEILITKNG